MNERFQPCSKLWTAAGANCSPRQWLRTSLLGHGHSTLSAGVRKEAARQRQQNRARAGPESTECPRSSGLCNTARALLVSHCNTKSLPARADTEVLWWVVTAQPNHALVISSAPLPELTLPPLQKLVLSLGA